MQDRPTRAHPSRTSRGGDYGWSPQHRFARWALLKGGRRVPNNERRRITLAHIVIVVVLVMWAGSMVLDAIVSTYDPPDTISIAFMAILGPLVGTLIVRRDRNSGDDDE